MGITRRLLKTSAALVCLAAFGQQADQIHAVENGLRPPYVIEGTPETTWKLADRMKVHHVPAVGVAAIQNGRIVWAKGYGDAKVDTLFQAASISKPVTALAALSMVRKGQLNLDEDVNVKLKSWKVPENEFTAKEKVTLRRLLSHSAGMTVHGFAGYAAGAPVPSLLQVLNGEKPANSDPIRVDVLPGSLWRYSGGGFTVVQQLMIDVTGRPFPEILHDAVLGPVEMTHSTYRQPLPKSLWDKAAQAYRADGKPVEGGWHTYPEMAAAGLWTTPSDLARFAIELRKEARGESDRVLTTELAKSMLTVQKGDYGLGIGLSGEGKSRHFGHGGANEGYRCDFQMYLESGDGAAIMTDSDSGSSLTSEIFRSIAAAYGWPDFKPRTMKTIKLDPAALRQYAGEYSLDGMQIGVALEDGKLWITPPGSSRAELLPQTSTQFFIGDMNLPQVTFEKDEKGEVTGLRAFGQTAKRVR
jgi:CubicO group peptidase (beta-lactamase class C family)